ncbi:hypothetical protein G6F43_013068 [Rhizopus delemar]|nr:hypothetical protein G6F43_013068 [Rhizopus delemar]
MPPDTNERSTIDSYLMQKAQSQYATNFQNLCTSPGRFRKILHKLLNDLLRIHLAPERNRKYTKYVKHVKETLETKKSEEQASQLPKTTHSRIQLANKSRNFRRNLFKTERSWRDKMLKKYAESGYKENKWKEKADRCDLRIQTYERILREEREEKVSRREQEASEQQLVHQESDESDDMLDFTNRSEELPANEERALELEDTETDITNDLPRRRINVLVAIIKAVLYEHPQELILSSHFQGNIQKISYF